MMQKTPSALLIVGGLILAFSAGSALTASALGDADRNLTEAVRLLKSAPTVRQNQEVFEKHRQQAIHLCQQAQQHIKVAQQAAMVPAYSTPGY